MAKTPKSLKAALAATRSYGRQLSKEATADYKVAMSASLAGQLGLAKQTRGLTRDLVMGQQKNNVMLQHLADRAAASKGQVRRGIAGTTSRYGAGLGASVASQYGQATATAASNAQVQKGYAAMGRRTMSEAQTVAAIAKSGIKAQAGAADYALAQALQQRNIADNQVVGEMTADLYKQQMAFEQQKELAKYQYQLEQKRLKKEEESKYPGLNAVVNSIGDDAQNFLAWYKTNQDKFTDNPAGAAQAWVTANIADPTEQAVAQVMATKMVSSIQANGGQIDDATLQTIAHNSVMTTLGTQYPNWHPSFDTVDTYLQAKAINGILGAPTSGEVPTAGTGSSFLDTELSYFKYLPMLFGGPPAD